MFDVQEKRKSYSFDEIQKMVENMDYAIEKESFKYYTQKFVVKDSNGYKFIMTDDNVRLNKRPKTFAKANPFTIENINNYIRINGICTNLLSKNYSGNAEKMLWQCVCGEKFERSWANFRLGATSCPKCSRYIKGLKSRTDVDNVRSTIIKRGYSPVSSLDNIVVSIDEILICDNDGYFYEINWPEFKQGKAPLRFHRGNPYTIRNINNFFIVALNGEFECISKKYVNNCTPLKFLHKKCGTVFSCPLSYLQRMEHNPERAYCECPKCNAMKTESHHASALKQVFLYNYPDTVVEDKSCINPTTSHSLPTDIVNHRLKIAIEVQSNMHDGAEQKHKDAIKKNFWIDKGYCFYDPDIRNYSVLEMIQLFFPETTAIPEYVNFNYSNCINFEKVQELLDCGFSLKEAASILDLNEQSVRHLVFDRKIKLPENYIRRIFNIRPIIRLSKDGDFIERYDSLSSLEDHGFANGTIRRVLRGEQDFSYDSFWLYEDDYISRNYVIPDIKPDKFLSSVSKYDMHGNFITTYKTIYEAENNSRSSKSEIYRVATGERKSSRNEKWKFV